MDSVYGLCNPQRSDVFITPAWGVLGAGTEFLGPSEKAAIEKGTARLAGNTQNQMIGSP